MRQRTTSAVVWCAVIGIIIVGLVAVAGTPVMAQSPVLTKWVDALPVPPVATSVATFNDGVHGTWPIYDITIRQFKQKFHRDLPATTVQAYGTWTPGPIIIAQRNQPIYVRFTNSLPTKPFFGIDRTLPNLPGLPSVRTSVHLHGGKSLSQFDGLPDQIFTVGQQKLFWYPNDQRATLLWFHDHALTVTRTNVYAGMAGAYVLRDNQETALNLPGPAGVYEIPLVIQDRLFDAAGKLVYTGMLAPPASFEPEFFGDTIIVNGKVWPFLNVEPRKYRLRILNGCNARFLNLRVVDGAAAPLTLNQIGNEGGLLPATVPLTQILHAPAERSDVIVDFSAYAGQTLTMTNDAATPFPMGVAPDANTSQILQIRVGTTVTTPDTTVIPANPSVVGRLRTTAAVVYRNIALLEGVDKLGRLKQTINGLGSMMPATEVCNEGAIEVWRFINTTVDTHPMHTHLVSYQVVDRTPFDVAAYMTTGVITPIGPPVAPDANEGGWKETARMNPGEVTRVIMKFPKTLNHQYTGNYVYHCHILEHEEHDMMRPLVVNPTP